MLLLQRLLLSANNFLDMICDLVQFQVWRVSCTPTAIFFVSTVCRFVFSYFHDFFVIRRCIFALWTFSSHLHCFGSTPVAPFAAHKRFIYRRRSCDFRLGDSWNLQSRSELKINKRSKWDISKFLHFRWKLGVESVFVGVVGGKSVCRKLIEVKN